MKRSDAIHQLSFRLSKSENLFKGYSKGNVSLKQLCDNLALRALRECEEVIGMEPPIHTIIEHLPETPVPGSVPVRMLKTTVEVREWEPEKEE